MRWLAGIAISVALLGAAQAEDGYARLEGHGGPVKGIAVSPDGRLAATASFDYSAGLWQIDGARRLRWLDGHDAAVNAAAFTPDGRRLITASDDLSLIEWDVATGKALARITGHKGKVMSVAVSPDGRMAASAGWDDRIGLWDLATGKSLGFLIGHRANVNAVVFSADGRTLWSASYDGSVRRWSVPDRALLHIEASHGFGVNLLALNEKARWIAYGAVDGVVRVIDLDTGAQLADLTEGRRPVLGLAMSPDGGKLAIGDGEGWIHVVATADWSTIRDFRAVPSGPVWALAFTGDGERLLASGLASHVDIWPIATARSVAEDTTPGRFHGSEELSNGEAQFLRKCSVCHTLSGDTARRAGPTLRGLFGRAAGSVADYSYSPALRSAGIVWDEATIDNLFELGPEHYTPGSKMPMQRIARPKDRADLIAFLKEATNPSGGKAP